MSAVDKTEKRKFATRLHGVGTAATIRENVVKDLRDNSVLVRSMTTHPTGCIPDSSVAIGGGFRPFRLALLYV